MVSVMNDYVSTSFNGSLGSSAITTSSANQLMNTTTSGSSPPHHQNESPLRLFGLAKQKINKIFEDINEFLKESDKFINTQDNLILLNNGNQVDFSTFIEGVKKIIKVLARDHMKVAFFGRTSNGKSTVINSVLHNNILPFGMGHTTNCFLQIEGIDSTEAYYVLDNNPDKKLNIDSIHQLANALNSDNIGDDTLCKVYWPKDKCNLLRDDVVLVDSPGIDVSPNLDAWIDKYCMDADVFVLVSNSESTLMRAEKSFFHKVSEKISKPNIFILNNRWDVVTAEGEAEKVKKQHTERSILFLCDELNVISKEEAEERVFFVSAKEVINTRIAGKQLNRSEMKEGYSERYFEFENFERKFEECLSKSAIKTKFNQHTKKGKEIMIDIGKFLDEIEKKSSELKRKKSEIRKTKYDKLTFTDHSFKLITEEIKRNIKNLSSTTETKVSAALNEEIRRLPLLLKDFEVPFSDEKLVLSVYKNQLSRFVETGLTANIKSRLNDTIYCNVQSSQQEMIQKVAALLPADDKKSQYIEFNVKPRESFEILFKLNCESICSDFQEDLEFRFSFGILTMFLNFMGTSKGKSIASNQKSVPPTAPQTPSNGLKEYATSSNEALSLVSKLIDLSPSSQTTVGALAIGGLMVRTIGVRVLLITCGVYAVVYTYERLTWTNKAKERTFKKQYVNHATRKLNCIVDLTGSNCSHQVQQELSSTFARLSKVVDESITEMRNEIAELEKEINRLDTCLTNIRVLKNKAKFCRIELDDFESNFLKDHDDE